MASISTSWSGDTRRETSIIVEAGCGGLKYLARAAETIWRSSHRLPVHSEILFLFYARQYLHIVFLQGGKR